MFACPLESVSLFCSINGTLLLWYAQEGNTEPMRVGYFRKNNTIGDGFSKLREFDCYGELIFSGVLEDILISSEADNISVCNSSMILPPLSWNASSNCGPLTIFCKPSNDPGEESINVTYQVAGKPLYLNGINSLVSKEDKKA